MRDCQICDFICEFGLTRFFGLVKNERTRYCGLSYYKIFSIVWTTLKLKQIRCQFFKIKPCSDFGSKFPGFNSRVVFAADKRPEIEKLKISSRFF